MTALRILQFLIVQSIFFGVIIFILRRTFLTSTQGAVKRLDSAVEENRKKQAELNQKIKEADEELSKRRKEADEMTKKMIAEAEEKAKEQKDKMVEQARKESEEVISKAQRTKDQMRQEIEKEMEMQNVDYATKIIEEIFSEKARDALKVQLVDDFLTSLAEVDMSQIGSDTESAQIITAEALPDDIKQKIAETIEKKLNREIKIENSVDETIVGGVVLRFGSLALDGSLKNQLFEVGTTLKEKVEKE